MASFADILSGKEPPGVYREDQNPRWHVIAMDVPTRRVWYHRGRTIGLQYAPELTEVGELGQFTYTKVNVTCDTPVLVRGTLTAEELPLTLSNCPDGWWQYNDAYLPAVKKGGELFQVTCAAVGYVLKPFDKTDRLDNPVTAVTPYKEKTYYECI